MRIDRLHLEQFKNLSDFSIDFEESELTSVLIGENGTGKSNLLEALVIIFRNLDLADAPLFGFTIDYRCRGRKIQISANPKADTSKYHFEVDDVKLSAKEFFGARQEYLPRHVFAYYSGPSRRLEEHFDKHQQRFAKALLDDEDRPLRPLFYSRLVHSQFVLLAYYSFPEEQIPEFLYEYLGIMGLESVLFVLRKPGWAKPRTSAKGARGGEGRFWRAKGKVSQFLSALWNHSMAPIAAEEFVRDDYRSAGGREERLYLFVQDQDSLENLAASYGTPGEFFKYLESTDISDLIREVRIKVRRRDLEGHITFQELSEGEQQLLTVLGLLKFMQGEESLFLLDEPDTHLNPKWKLQYLTLLEKVVGKNPTSQLLISTHDPLTIAGLKSSQVQIFRSSDGSVVASPPLVNPQGLGVAGVLTRLFGLPSTLDPATQSKLTRREHLVAQTPRSADEQNELQDLSHELFELGFASSLRDPMYERFVRAVASRPEFQQPALTDEERDRQELIANRIVDELLAEQAQSNA